MEIRVTMTECAEMMLKKHDKFEAFDNYLDDTIALRLYNKLKLVKFKILRFKGITLVIVMVDKFTITIYEYQEFKGILQEFLNFGNN